MTQESDNQKVETFELGPLWRKCIILVLIVAAVAGGSVWFFDGRDSGESEEQQVEEMLTKVSVRQFSDLVNGSVIEKVATLEPANGAPLIARTGGRVTAVVAQLGEAVQAGSVIVAIDGAGEASPARAQLAGARNALASFDRIEREALASVDLAIGLSELSLDAVKAGRSLTAAQVAKGREQADLAVEQARLVFEDATEAEDRVEAVVRAADLAQKAAGLAQDQATIARDFADRSTGDVVNQTELGLLTALQAKDRLMADLAGQRVGIVAQVAAANAQVRLAQVTSPLAGQVTNLSVKVGDFVRPGEQVGEIIAFEGARVTIEVATGVREKLAVGQAVPIRSGSQDFTGEVVRLADAPRTDIALWQVDIFIASTPEVVHPGELVTVVLPVGSATETAAFIPLDVVVVRQDGIVLFTVDDEGLVHEHIVETIGFTGSFVEAYVTVADDARVVVSGNRTLRDGERVEVVVL